MVEDGAGYPRALVRRPGPRLREALVTHAIGAPVDADLAERQWRGYVGALRAEGWEIVEVPPADNCPDAVFVEDTVVVYRELAVITRPGADERKPEVAGTMATLASLGYRIAVGGGPVLSVPVSRTLHLKSSLTALPDGTIVGFEPLVDDPAVWPSFLSVPEEAGAHVVVLDASAVLMSTRAPATRALFESRGLRAVSVDISEYEKLDGGVTCLSVRLRG